MKALGKNLDATFLDSIKLRLRSDVPVGALLSGGIDSSTIVAAVSKINDLENFKTFSAVFDDEKISERPFIEDTAKSLNFSPNFRRIHHTSGQNDRKWGPRWRTELSRESVAAFDTVESIRDNERIQNLAYQLQTGM